MNHHALWIALAASLVGHAPAGADQSANASSNGLSGRFSMEQPNYFATGLHPHRHSRDELGHLRRHNEVKFRVSVRFLAIGSVGGSRGLFVGFTQDALWNLFDTSAPFYDDNFAPQAYWENAIGPASYRIGARTVHSYTRLGIVHQSNGRDGTDSRGWNRAFLSIGAEGRPQAQNARPMPRVMKADVGAVCTVWVPWGQEEAIDIDGNVTGTEAIAKYVGFGEASVSVSHPYSLHGWIDGVALSAKARLAERRGVSAVELALYVGAPGKFRSWFAPMAYVQFFNGYGENLLDYDKESQVLRVGFAISD